MTPDFKNGMVLALHGLRMLVDFKSRRYARTKGYCRW